MNSGRSTAATLTQVYPPRGCNPPEAPNLACVSDDVSKLSSGLPPAASISPYGLSRAWTHSGLESELQPLNASSSTSQPVRAPQQLQMPLQQIYIRSPDSAERAPPQEVVEKASETVGDQDVGEEHDLSSSGFGFASQASEEWVPAAQRRRCHARSSKQCMAAAGGGGRELKLSGKVRQDRRYAPSAGRVCRSLNLHKAQQTKFKLISIAKTID
jgi:hypothetical protein